MRDGRPRLIGLYGEGGRKPGRTEGMLELRHDVPQRRHAGDLRGALPAEFAARPGRPRPGDRDACHPRACRRPSWCRCATPRGAASTRSARRLVGRGGHPRGSDEDALERVLRPDAGYVSLVASRKRAGAILETLSQRGVPAEPLGRLKAPAGLDIGAVTPEEIAVSILAEIIQIAGRQDPGRRACGCDRSRRRKPSTRSAA